MDWARLAQAIVDRRVELGFRTRESFATAKGLSSRLAGDLERGARDNYDSATFARLEQALEWPAGRVRQILRDGVEQLAVGAMGGQLLHPDGWQIPAEVAGLIGMLRPDGNALDDAGRAVVLQLVAAVCRAATEIGRRSLQA